MRQPEINIRDYHPFDTEAIIGIERSSREAPVNAKAIKESLANGRCCCWVATADRQVIGFLTARPRKVTFEISGLTVDGSFRHRRIGSALYAASRGYALLSGYRAVETRVLESNLPAQMFLKSVGSLCARIDRANSGSLAVYVFEDRLHDS